MCELKHHLGVSYPTASSIKRKLPRVMTERGGGRKLSGIIELDDVYCGGERRGEKPGRGSRNKVPFIAAVATNQRGEAVRMRLSLSPSPKLRDPEIAADRRLE